MKLCESALFLPSELGKLSLVVYRIYLKKFQFLTEQFIYNLKQAPSEINTKNYEKSCFSFSEVFLLDYLRMG